MFETNNSGQKECIHGGLSVPSSTHHLQSDLGPTCYNIHLLPDIISVANWQSTASTDLLMSESCQVYCIPESASEAKLCSPLPSTIRQIVQIPWTKIIQKTLLPKTFEEIFLDMKVLYPSVILWHGVFEPTVIAQNCVLERTWR